MISTAGNYIEQKISAIPEDCDLPNLLNLFLAITQSPSFVISIPVLVTWTRLLRSETIGGSPTITPLIAPLLELCSSRLIRYESMPEDSDDPSLLFLHEDIDTQPERHAFLGNYRRYSTQVIEYIVRQKQSEAIYHILSQVDQSMHHLYDGQPPFAGLLYHLERCWVPLTFASCELFQNFNACLASRRSLHCCGSRSKRIYEMEISTWLEAPTRCKHTSKPYFT
jgi:exportin-5